MLNSFRPTFPTKIIAFLEDFSHAKISGVLLSLAYLSSLNLDNFHKAKLSLSYYSLH